MKFLKKKKFEIPSFDYNNACTNPVTDLKQSVACSHGSKHVQIYFIFFFLTK